MEKAVGNKVDQKPATSSKQDPEMVAVVSWNYGAARRTPTVPTDDARHDPDWYKKPPPRRGLLARLRGLFR